MKTYAIKRGKQFLQITGGFGSIKGATLFPTKKQAQQDIDLEGEENNEKVAVIEVTEVK